MVPVVVELPGSVNRRSCRIAVPVSYPTEFPWGNKHVKFSTGLRGIVWRYHGIHGVPGYSHDFLAIFHQENSRICDFGAWRYFSATAELLSIFACLVYLHGTLYFKRHSPFVHHSFKCSCILHDKMCVISALKHNGFHTFRSAINELCDTLYHVSGHSPETCCHEKLPAGHYPVAVTCFPNIPLPDVRLHC